MAAIISDPTPFRLGSVYQRGNRLYDHVMPVLRALVAQGTESPSFHVRHDAKLRLCVARIDSQHSTLDRVCAGALLPLDRGAAGTIIMAFDGASHGEKFDRARQARSAISYGERDPDCAGIASPVFGADDKLVGALSVSGPKSRFTDDNVRKMSAQVIEAAQRITYSLGGRKPGLPDAARPCHRRRIGFVRHRSFESRIRLGSRARAARPQFPENGCRSPGQSTRISRERHSPC